MDIRPYQPIDHDACLAILDVTAPAQRAGFATFLDRPQCPYFVMVHETEIVGCGGFSISSNGTSARLAWGMIRQNLQRQGLGRFLLMFRLREIGKLGSVQIVYVDAPNAIAPFFEKQGFRTVSVSEDRTELMKKLIVCA